MNPTNDDKRWALTPKEREDWERTRQRGRFRCLLLCACAIAISFTVALAIVSTVTDFCHGIPLVVRLPLCLALGMLLAIPSTFIFGMIFWACMERRYQVSLDCCPAEPELREHRARDRRYLLMALPLLVGASTVFLPKPFGPSLVLVCWGFAPFLLIYASIKDGTWDDRRGAVPINHPRAIAGITVMILCGVAFVAFGCFGIYSEWKAK